MSGEVMLRLSAAHIKALRRLAGGRPHSRLAAEIVDAHLRGHGFESLPALRSAGAPRGRTVRRRDAPALKRGR